MKHRILGTTGDDVKYNMKTKQENHQQMPLALALHIHLYMSDR